MPWGPQRKARANLDALVVLSRLEAEGRPEQQVLAAWSGWGAVPQVFDDDQGTAELREQLRGLLSRLLQVRALPPNRTVDGAPLSANELGRIDRNWRAANYLSVGRTTCSPIRCWPSR